jgi:hypothetical protein
MANIRQFDVEDILIRPGTYFNPQTEVLIVVDDSPDLGTEIFDMEEYEGSDWVLISDEQPIDEQSRDELMEAFQVRHGAGDSTRLDAGDDVVHADENAPPEADEVEDE